MATDQVKTDPTITLLALPAVGDNAAMQTEPPNADSPKRKRRWFQFSLRTLMIGVTLLAIPLGYVGWQVKIARQRGLELAALGQIGDAFQKFHNVHGAMPPAAIFSPDGKPLLSWRVALLPYLNETALYEQFQLDEPWDSEHNQKLLAKMPTVYAPRRGPTPKQPYSTYYQVFTGKDAPFHLQAGVVVKKDFAFAGTLGPKFTDFTDGTAQTFLVVDSSEAVEWTKPVDLAYEAGKPLPGLGFDDRFYLVLADGSPHFMKKSMPEDVIRGGITPRGQKLRRGFEGFEGNQVEPVLYSDKRDVLDKE